MATVIINEATYKVEIEPETHGTISILPAKGTKGDTGPANTLAIGTVTAGDTAAATITGTAPNQTLNLTLPKGDKGDKGDTGSTGATGPANTLSIGTVTKGNDAAATITGTAPNQTLNLTLPKGDKGEKGDTGTDGVSPRVVLTQLTSTTAKITVTDATGTSEATFGGTYEDGDGEEY